MEWLRECWFLSCNPLLVLFGLDTRPEAEASCEINTLCLSEPAAAAAPAASAAAAAQASACAVSHATSAQRACS